MTLRECTRLSVVPKPIDTHCIIVLIVLWYFIPTSLDITSDVSINGKIEGYHEKYQ